MSPPEGFWRLASYETHKRSHTVQRLPVHLEGYHNVYFVQGDQEEILRQARHDRTHLTAFFELNQTDVNARQYFYHEIPIHYTWQRATRSWRRRRRQQTANNTLARMYTVNPQDRERFNLRLLLLHTKGAQFPRFKDN